LRVRSKSALWSLIVIAAGALPALAEESSRVEALEREVAELRGVVEELQRERAERKAAEAKPVAIEGTPAARAHDHHQMSRIGRPQLTIGGFGHVKYVVDDVDPDAGERDTEQKFQLGNLDVFLTSRLSDQLSFLSEISFEFEEDGENFLDVERLLASYDVADWLRATVGRTHTPMGYWNVTYHHGTWLQTTVERPLLFEFEDDHGILPVHSVGLELSGYLNTAAGSLGYTLNAGNGRSSLSETVQNATDLNDSKMFAGMLTFAPDAIAGLTVGANALADWIPPNGAAVPPTVGRLDTIEEQIAGGFLAYTLDPFELLVEGQWIRHRDREVEETTRSGGLYAQAAYKIGAFKPYYRFEWLDLSERDRFYANTEGAEDTQLHIAGVRWDFQEFAALKLEVRRRLTDSFDSIEGAAELSFAF
jgi:hypothetical protein